MGRLEIPVAVNNMGKQEESYNCALEQLLVNYTLIA